MIMLEITGECEDHDPPHDVYLDTDRLDLPDPPCGGNISVYEVTGECHTCGELIDGEFYAFEVPHACPNCQEDET